MSGLVTDQLLRRVAPEVAVRGTCALHGQHRPPYLYIERHHVVPQAWQHWQNPADKPVHQGVWDPRTVDCCRTGHGNVHVFIVAYMQEQPASWRDVAPNEVALRAHMANVDRQLGIGRSHHEERGYAQQALLRWQQWGGNVAALAAVGLYGGI